jgi:hypothetical protein
MCINSCSSASLSSSGFSSSRSTQVFLTMALPDPRSSSFKVVILSNSMCWYMEFWRAGVMSSESGKMLAAAHGSTSRIGGEISRSCSSLP